METQQQTLAKSPEPNKKKIGFFKKIGYHLKLWSGIWAVPLIALIFTVVGLGLQQIFGAGVGFYDPSILQAAFLAGFIFVLFNALTFFSFYFHWRHLWKYYLRDGVKDIYENLKGWQRLCLVLFLYCFSMVVLFFLIRLIL